MKKWEIIPGWLFSLSLITVLILTQHGLVQAQTQSGVDTLRYINNDPDCGWCGDWEFFDFSEATTFLVADTANFDADIRGSSNEGVNFGQEFSTLIRDYAIQLLGTGNIDTVQSVPEWSESAPWVNTSWESTGYQPVQVGQLWAVYTAENHYAVLEIAGLPDGDFGHSLAFKYKYQSDGTRFFDVTDLGGGELAGSATSTSGTGFDFSREETADNHDSGDYLPDFVFVNNEGVNFGNEGSSSLSGTGRRFLLIGEGELSDVGLVPEREDASPWITVSYDWTDGTGGLPISVGELWAVYTREGHYAIMEITSLPEGNFGTSFTFDYRYLDDGNRDFGGSGVVQDTLETPILNAPANQASDISTYPVLEWNPIPDAEFYTLEFATDASFSNIIYSSSDIEDTSAVIEDLQLNTAFYWRVKAGTSGNKVESEWSEVWSFTTTQYEFAGGSGTELDPYQISNAAQLQAIINHLDAHFVLVNDVDASSTEHWNNGDGFDPVGSGRSAFTGSLSGKGHIISGLYINRPDMNAVGLFSQVNAAAKVRQLGIENAQVVGQNGIGILAGSNYGLIEEVYTTGSVSGQAPSGNRVGGIIGINYGGTVQNSYSWASVSGDEGVGGLIGGALDSVKLHNSYASNIVTGNSWTYGLVGYMAAEVHITNSYWNEDLSGLSNGYAGDGEGLNGLTESQMKYQSSYQNWNFITVWDIDPFESYPYLRFTDVVEAEQPEPVELLSVISQNDEHVLRLTWTESHDPYFLRYRVYKSTDGETFTFADSTDRDGFSVDSSWTIVELENLQEYFFKVTVVNAFMMESEFSNVMSGTPYPRPERIESLSATPSDGSILLSWSPADTTYFSHYLISGGEVGSDFSTIDTVWSVSDTSAVIENLINGTEYQFVVGAVNRFGKKGNSSPLVKSTPESPYIEKETTIANLIHGSVSLADVDNDGDLDLLITGQENDTSFPQTMLYYNEGDGTYSHSEQVINGVINSSVFWYDIDRNGYADLILSGETGQGAATLVYMNNEGIFTLAPITLPGLAEGTVSPADYDNDGDLDFLISGISEELIQTILVKNNGEEGFETISVSLEGLMDGAASWGDFDGDGFPDLLLAGENADGDVLTKLYRNTGSDSFEEVAVTIPGVVGGNLVWADFNLDAHPDIFVAGYTSSARMELYAGIWLNNGEGFDLLYDLHFESLMSKVNAGQLAKAAVSAGDYDNDGDIDVLLSAKTGGTNLASILKNNRDGVTRQNLDIGDNGRAVWADIDGDGDLDIFVTGAGEDGDKALVFENTTQARNTAPTVPSGLKSSVSEGAVTLSWESSSDEQTPSEALTYNVRVGTASGLSDILSANADPETGLLSVPKNGNTGYKNRIVLSDLPQGTYFWQVQAVDNGFLGSEFSAEQEFTVGPSVSNELFDEVPEKFELRQNYPNPFNPNTKISFALPSQANVTLEVFDITGKRVATLVDRNMKAGNHQINFDAGSLSSGMYIYRMQTSSGEVFTRKMVLIK